MTRSRLGAPVNDSVGPAVSVSGWRRSASTSSPTGRDLDVIAGGGHIVAQHGSHLVKTGVDFLYNRATILFPGALQGSYTFTTLANLQRGATTSSINSRSACPRCASPTNLGVRARRVASGAVADADRRIAADYVAAIRWCSMPTMSPRIGGLGAG